MLLQFLFLYMGVIDRFVFAGYVRFLDFSMKSTLQFQGTFHLRRFDFYRLWYTFIFLVFKLEFLRENSVISQSSLQLWESSDVKWGTFHCVCSQVLLGVQMLYYMGLTELFITLFKSRAHFGFLSGPDSNRVIVHFHKIGHFWNFKVCQHS